MRALRFISLVGVLATLVMTAGAAAARKTASQARPQSSCPVTGKPIGKGVSTTCGGQKVSFCCAMCRRKFLADPGACLANLPQFGGAEPPAHLAHDSTVAVRRAPLAESPRDDQPSAGLLAMLPGFATATSAHPPVDLSNTFLLHRATGVATAILAVPATATVRWREGSRRARRALWLGLLLPAAVAVAAARHFGATLVHGHDPFLFSSGGS